MSTPEGWLRPAALALRGGRAPPAWRRELAVAVAPLAGLARAGRWISALSRLSLLLHSGPVWGQALDGWAAGRNSPTSSPARPRLRSSAADSPPGPAAIGTDTESASPAPPAGGTSSGATLQTPPAGANPSPPGERAVARRSEPPLADLPKTASQMLLSRLGQTKAQSRRPAESDRAGLPASPATVSPLPAPGSGQREMPEATISRRPVRAVESPGGTPATRRSRPRGSTLARLVEPARQSVWRQALGRRVARALQGGLPGSVGNADSSTLRLDSLWSQPLKGVMAPPAVLVYLAKRRTPGADLEARGQETSPAAVDPAPTTSTRDPAAPALPPVPAKPAELLPSVGHAGAGLARDPLGGLPAKPVELSDVGHAGTGFARDQLGGLPAKTGKAATPPTPVASEVPPASAVTPSLPPLLPPQEPGALPPPIATVIAWQEARAEAVEVPDDLDALAARIQLILDEQARRHGIDV